MTRALSRIGQQLLVWAQPQRGEDNSFLPDCLQVEVEWRRMQEEFDTHVRVYNAWAEHFSRRVRLYHAEIFQEGVRKGAIHVRVTEDGRGFRVQRHALSPEQMECATALSMEAIDLAICRHHLGEVEGKLEETAVENTIRKIVAEQI